MTWISSITVGSTLTVIRGQVDVRTEQWVETSRHDVTPVAVDPTGSSESAGPTGNEDSLQADVTLYGPYGADVLSTDRAILDGDQATLYDVAGVAQQWRSPFTGAEYGSVIRLVHHQGG